MSDHTANPVQLPMFDPVVIKLTKGYTTIVDPIDADLARHKWYYNNNMYARRNTDGSEEYLHRIILGRMLDRDLHQCEWVDHISGNTLDNRRNNLRLSTPSQNAGNSRRRKDSGIGLKGVTRSRHKAKPWCARLTVQGKTFYLGDFVTPEEAHAAYCEAAKKHHGDFARFE